MGPHQQSTSTRGRPTPLCALKYNMATTNEPKVDWKEDRIAMTQKHLVKSAIQSLTLDTQD